MKIYFDYSTMHYWSGQPTGIPRTVFSLALAMKKLYPLIKLVSFDEKKGCFRHLIEYNNNYYFGEDVNFEGGDMFFSASAGWAFERYVEQLGVAKSSGVVIFILFYDLIPAMFPYFYKDGIKFGKYYRDWCRGAFLICDGAFAISCCTKRDIVSNFELSAREAESIRVVRLGDDFSPADGEPQEAERFRDLGKFLLSVGTLEVRKNQVTLLNAYRLLAERCADRLPILVLAGKKGWLDGEIRFQIENDHAIGHLVRVVSDASDIELDWLYKNCYFSLFPALYEGWGLPVAESLKSGKVCICSNTSSMIEIAPQLTIFASPFSSQSWAYKIEHLLLNPEYLEKLNEEIRIKYSVTTWISTAREIIETIMSRR